MIMKVSNDMKEYLRKRFYYNNHPKYRKYFDEWLSGICDSQVMYFEKEKYRIENNVVLK